MKTWKRIFIVAMTLSALIGLGSSALAQESGVRKKVVRPAKPAIWEQASGQNMLAAERVARLDAISKLIGRIYGELVASDSVVIDFLLEDYSLESFLNGRLSGMKETKVVYHDDGSMQLKMEVTRRQVVEIITDYVRVEKKSSIFGDKSEEEFKREISQIVREDLFTAWGSGALRGTRGLKVVRAQRAAELDAMGKLAERIKGIQVDRETIVQDFILAHDQIVANVAAVLRGVRFDNPTVDDKTVQIEASVKLRRIIERIERTYKQTIKGDPPKKIDIDALTKVSLREETTVLTEVGKAAIDGDYTETTYVEVQVIERILREEFVP